MKYALSLLIHMVNHAWFPNLCYYPRKCLDNPLRIQYWWASLQFANCIHALDCTSISPAQRCLCLQLRVSWGTCLLTFLPHCCVVAVTAGCCECPKDTQGSLYQSSSSAEELELSSPGQGWAWQLKGNAKCSVSSQNEVDERAWWSPARLGLTLSESVKERRKAWGDPIKASSCFSWVLLCVLAPVLNWGFGHQQLSWLSLSLSFSLSFSLSPPLSSLSMILLRPYDKEQIIQHSQLKRLSKVYERLL